MPDSAIVTPPAPIERGLTLNIHRPTMVSGRSPEGFTKVAIDGKRAGLSADRFRRLRFVRRKCAKDFSLRRRHDRLLNELRLAEQVQRSMLPRMLPNLPEVEFGAALRPTRHLAGDFYNVLRLDSHRVGVCLGDVMGHGPAAALLGVFAMQGIRTKTIDGTSYAILPPEEVVANLSRDLIRADFPENPFVTMIYGVLDTSRGTLNYCCGGHPPAILLSEGQPPHRLEGRGPLLGVFELPFEPCEVLLKPGDRIALYSDGVESIRWGKYGSGVDGLMSRLQIRDGRTPQALVDDAIAIAEPGDGPSDDVTIVLFEMRR
jgi:phosphoserine phosphatase RsbU/P